VRPWKPDAGRRRTAKLPQIDPVSAKTDQKIVITPDKSAEIVRFQPAFAKLLHYGNNEAENIRATTGYATSCRFLSETGSLH
jgi:hypothetical protein